MAYQFKDILVTAGVQKTTDFTESSTPHYVDATAIRFRDGLPEKIGGWESQTYNNGNEVVGCCRSIFSYNLSRNVRYIFGTHNSLYYAIGSQLTNITPLDSATTTIANSLDSNYGTLANDPVATVSGSTTITITDTATKVRVGDTIELSGSSAVNGVPAIEINTTHFVRTQDTNSYTFEVTTSATSTGSGGGAAVVQATSIITVNKTAHGINSGQRIKLTGATAFAGIPAGDINAEHVIRNSQTNTFDIVVDTIATSSVSGGGGASTAIQEEIAEGKCDASAAQGYGAGLYGTGLYGTALASTAGEIPVRSWVFDRFGDNVLATPGQQTGIYTWDSDTDEAPALLSGAPTAVNYIFVSNEIVVTLGSGGVVNRIKWSDQGDSTSWTAASTNQAGEDDIEGASEFISHAQVKGINLLFTESRVYTFRYIGRPLIWETKLLDEKSGIIGKNARVQHAGVVYWMGSDNFYYYKGGRVEIIPSNTTTETTLKEFVFDDLNLSQISKTFAWFNRRFNEVWWHYPSSASNEPNRIIRFNVKTFTWTPDTLERSAGEYPTQLKDFPFLAEVEDDDDSTIYQHEKGANDDGSALGWSLKTNRLSSDGNVIDINGLIPDSLQTGDITVVIDGYEYAQSTTKYSTQTLTVSSTTEFYSFKVSGRYIQYTLSGSAVDQTWRAGRWQHTIGPGGRN